MTCCKDSGPVYGQCAVCRLLWNDVRQKVVRCCNTCHVFLCASGHNWIDRGVAAIKKKLRGDPDEC